MGPDLRDLWGARGPVLGTYLGDLPWGPTLGTYLGTCLGGTGVGMLNGFCVPVSHIPIMTPPIPIGVTALKQPAMLPYCVNRNVSFG